MCIVLEMSFPPLIITVRFLCLCVFDSFSFVRPAVFLSLRFVVVLLTRSHVLLVRTEKMHILRVFVAVLLIKLSFILGDSALIVSTAVSILKP